MEKLTIFTDGGARGNPGPAAIGVVIYKNAKLISEIGEKIGVATNNLAEYQALERAFEEAVKICQSSKIDIIEVFADSQLVIRQVTGQYKIKNRQLGEILGKILKLEKQLPPVKFNLIPRGKNKAADRLVNLALDSQQ